MIQRKYNLICKRGHRHYAPNPEYWVGVSCGKPFETPLSKDGSSRASYEKCMEPMHRIRRKAWHEPVDA